MALRAGGRERDTARAMSEENVENVRAGYERFAATGDFAPVATADFVWDVSNLHWPGQQVYEGADGARTFLREWADAWEDWEMEGRFLPRRGRQGGCTRFLARPLEIDRDARLDVLRPGLDHPRWQGRPDGDVF